MSDQSPAPVAPAPVAPAQSNDDAIGNFARGFLGELERDQDPNQNTHATPEEAATDDPTEQADEGEQEAETPTPETPDIPMFEYDIDGEKFQVPEKLKGRLMADKDYRQKTMALAETRKQAESLIANAAQIAQQAQQMAPYHAHLYQMENHAQFLNQRLQSQELAQDPVEYNRVQGELAILLHNKDRYAQGLNQQVSQLSQQQQYLRAQQLALDAPKLFEEFPDIAKPETQQKLAKYVLDEGLPQMAIDFLNFSTAGTKLAWKAHQYDVMVKEQASSRAKLQEKVKTLPGAAQSSRAADKGAKDNQLRSEWKKGGGKMNDPAFSALLRSKIYGR